MLERLYILVLLAAFGCSNVATTDPADAGRDASDADAVDMANGGDVDDEADLEKLPDGDVPADLGLADAGPADCADLTPAACMDDPTCTLDNGCGPIRNAEPYPYLQTGAWVGTAELTNEAGLPGGETDAFLMVHRDSERYLRGVVTFPEFDIDHAVSGGVGPGGELGLYFGPPRCTESRCDAEFGRAYDVGGQAQDLSMTLETVLVDRSVTEFQTVTSMRLAPSDGFKPVGPIFPRPDVLVANWIGDMVAVDEAGQLLDLTCDFEIAAARAGHNFVDFGCTNDGSELDTAEGIRSADASTIAHEGGLAWFATGPDPDDLAFVGRVAVETPWEGVVVRRGTLLDGPAPIAPEDVPLESIRGTFQFYAFGTSP